ncbi:MAG: FhaA domain-containing protein [Eggerthella lenta]
MGFLSRFEGRMEDTFEGAADKMFDAPISPVQIAKKAEKQMRREKMVGAGKQYAPTLYTVLVNPDDDRRLMGYYPTLAGETETYLTAKASEQGLVMDGQPLVRFIVDEDLKHGKFDIIAEAVAAPIIAQLRAEDASFGLAAAPAPAGTGRAALPRAAPSGAGSAAVRRIQPGLRRPAPRRPYTATTSTIPKASTTPPRRGRVRPAPAAPYVPEDEIDRSSTTRVPSTAATRRAARHRHLSRPEAVDPFASAQPQPVREPPAPLPERYGRRDVAATPPRSRNRRPAAHGRRNRRVRRRAASGDPMPAQAAVRARLIDTTNNRA